MAKDSHEVHAREIAIVALILRLAELWPDKRLWKNHFGGGFEWSVITTYGTPGVKVGELIGVVVHSREWEQAGWHYEITCVLKKTEAGWMPDNGHLACVLASGCYHTRHNFCAIRDSSETPTPPFPHMKEVNH